MTVESPRIRSLLRQADKVAESGKRAAAEQLYRQIIDEAPETAQAWYGLAQVVGETSEKEDALQRALELDPSYDDIDEPLGDAIDVAQDSVDKPEEVETEPVSTPLFSEDGGKAHVDERVKEELLSDSVGDEQGHVAHVPASSATEVAESADEAVTLYCANHPTRKTHLRCNRCGKPICSSCANPTPVGYRCPECIREQEDVYYTATPVNYFLATLVTLPLALVAGWLATRLGFWSIFLAAFAGTLIGRVAFRAASRRRGRWLPQLVSACVIIGGVLPALPFLLAMFFGQFSLQLLFTGIYIVMATGATYYQMR